MESFTFATTANIVMESGVTDRLSELCQQAGARHVLVVTDPGIRAVGLLDAPLESFAQSNIAVAVFDQVEADPSEKTVLSAARFALEHQADMVIGFGGGSAMDVAKLVALLAHPGCNQKIEQMYGVGLVKGGRLPLMQVPTTAGTGSEVTPIAIITTGETTKAGVVSPVLLPDHAILDAKLTLGLPPHVTAATGIDAMVHAIEAYTSKIRKNPLSDMLARQALTLLAPNVLEAVGQGSNLAVREKMLLGACLAGQAFANSPVGGVHALAYPLGGHFHIPHGLSNALVLPHVMRFNRSACETQYAEIAQLILGQQVSGLPEAQQVDQLIDWLAGLSVQSGLPHTLRACKVPEDALPMLAEEAMKQQRLLVNNPREISQQDALDIYQQAF